MAKITEEELKTIVSVKKDLDSLVSQIGIIETQKHALLHKVAEVNEELSKEKEKLEKAYGKVSIDLETGDYKEITEEE
jgi:uncharacterized protein YoxC